MRLLPRSSYIKGRANMLLLLLGGQKVKAVFSVESASITFYMAKKKKAFCL
jgi:hypothetical protein